MLLANESGFYIQTAFKTAKKRPTATFFVKDSDFSAWNSNFLPDVSPPHMRHFLAGISESKLNAFMSAVILVNVKLQLLNKPNHFLTYSVKP